MRSALLFVLLGGCDAVFGIVAVPDARPDVGLEVGGLVAYWPMDDVVGGKIADASGGGHDGVCFGSACPPASVAGAIATALPFDGTTTLFQIDGAALDTPNGFSVTAWLSMPVGPAIVYCPLDKLYGPGNDNSWQLCVLTDNELVFYSQANELRSIQRLANNQWQFIALLYDADAGEASIEIDGVVTNRVAFPAPVFDGGVVTIGADIDSGGATAFFDGAIDDVRLYRRPLAIDELVAVRAGRL